MRRVTLAVAVVMLLGAVLAVPGMAAQQPKTLYVGLNEKITSLDPQRSAETATFLLGRLIFAPLVARDAEGKFVPQLAASWEVIDPKTWRFTLRQDVRLHDGTPFTSADVAYTFARFANEGKGSPLASLWTVIEAVETPDPHTVIIRTTAPVGAMLSNLSVTNMVPRKASTPGFFDRPVGMGPFEFVEWVPGDHLTLRANPNYFNGKPAIDRLVFREIPEIFTRTTALERGDLQFVEGIPAEMVESLARNPQVEVVKAPSYRLRWLWINSGVKPFDDRRVRQALAYAIDRQAITDGIMGGLTKPLNGVVAPDTVGYHEMPAYPYDPAKAKELLREAGYPNGFRASLDVTETEPKQLEIAQTIAAYLEQVGIQVEIRRKDRSAWVSDLVGMRWQLNLFSNTSLTGDVDFQLRRLFHSSAKRLGYVNNKLDRLLEAQAAQTDPSVRDSLLREVGKTLWEDVPAIWLFVEPQVVGVRKEVKGFVPTADGLWRFEAISLP